MTDPAPQPPPGIVIRLELEAKPRVLIDADREPSVHRLEDWLRAHPRYGRLVADALELADEEIT